MLIGEMKRANLRKINWLNFQKEILNSHQFNFGCSHNSHSGLIQVATYTCNKNVIYYNGDLLNDEPHNIGLFPFSYSARHSYYAQPNTAYQITEMHNLKSFNNRENEKRYHV